MGGWWGVCGVWWKKGGGQVGFYSMRISTINVCAAVGNRRFASSCANHRLSGRRPCQRGAYLAFSLQHGWHGLSDGHRPVLHLHSGTQETMRGDFARRLTSLGDDMGGHASACERFRADCSPRLRQGGEWRIVHHHGSPQPPAPQAS